MIAALLSSVAAAQPAEGANIDVHRLEGWAEDLRSGDEVRVREAVRHLGHLPATAMEAMGARLARTRRQVVPEEDGYDALRYFRHAVGSRRADDDVDIAPGVPAVLLERPSPAVGRTAERLLILRSLEAIRTVEAQKLMGDVLALTPSMWRWERRRLLARMGRRLLPGLIWLRGHREPDVRRWARAAVGRLRLNNPGLAVQGASDVELAELFEAYAAMRIMDAMPVIISYVGHEDDGVREAARSAMERYGQNGIWQLREAMRNQLGAEADLEVGWRETAQQLFDGLDERRLGPVTRRLEEALEATEAGNHAEALALADAVLLEAPAHPRRAELARVYASAAEDAGNEAHLQRAQWLAPTADVAARLAEMQRSSLEAAGLELAEEQAAQSDERVAPAPAADFTSSMRGFPIGGLALTLLAAFALWRKRSAIEEIVRRLQGTGTGPSPGCSKTQNAMGSARAFAARAHAVIAALSKRLRPFAQRTFDRVAPLAGRLRRFALHLHAGPEAVRDDARRAAERRAAENAPSPASPAGERPRHNPSTARTSLGALMLSPAADDPTTEPDATAPDVDETMPGTEAPTEDLPAPWLAAATTSPGAVEAPDTLPG
ncbi:MAG: hypothetical protein AAF938_07760 [Myxococcota bacterium]